MNHVVILNDYSKKCDQLYVQDVLIKILVYYAGIVLKDEKRNILSLIKDKGQFNQSHLSNQLGVHHSV